MDVSSRLSASGPDRPNGSQQTDAESDQSDKRAHSPDNNLSPCRYFLPFSGCSGSLGGIRGPHLGVQIGSLVGVGFLFAACAVVSLFWSFYNSDWHGKVLGLACGIFCIAGMFFAYGWAFTGHPAGLLRSYVGG